MIREAPTHNLPRIGGFEEWVRVVGRAVALDAEVGPHFLENIANMWEAEDSDASDWEEFLVAWAAWAGRENRTTREFAMQVCKVGESGVRGFRENEDLYFALPSDLQTEVDKPGFAKMLGIALSAHAGTRFGDKEYRIVNSGKDLHARRVYWRAEWNE